MMVFKACQRQVYILLGPNYPTEKCPCMYISASVLVQSLYQMQKVYIYKFSVSQVLISKSWKHKFVKPLSGMAWQC